MEVFERRDCRVVILQENSTVQLCLYDSFYDVAFTDPSILFCIARGFCNCLRDRIAFNILKVNRLKSPCIIDVKRVPGNKYSWLFYHLFKWKLIRR